MDHTSSRKAFMYHINYSYKVTLTVSIRVMYLNNNQFKHELYNSSIVTKIHDQEDIDETKIFHIIKIKYDVLYT